MDISSMLPLCVAKLENLRTHPSFFKFITHLALSKPTNGKTSDRPLTVDRKDRKM